MFNKFRHIHFVGIGGSGMSGIAEVLINLGYKVSGSDIMNSMVTQRLEKLGGKIFIGHKSSNINGSHVVVISSAIQKDNPEIRTAYKKNIPVIPRAEMLAELMRLKYAIAVAGTHGKTTTTSLIALVLAKGGLDPTVVIGGKLNNIESNAKLGQGEYLVAEADESDGSFLHLTPTFAVVTNVDSDHLDFYKSMDKLNKAFIEFVNKVPFYGSAILCLDNENIRSWIKKVRPRCVTYGIDSPDAQWQAKNACVETVKSSFDVVKEGENLGRITINIGGSHNITNSLAAVAVGWELGLKIEDISESLNEFKGVERRLQVKGEVGGILIFDDYAHHPTEIKATLSSLKKSGQRRVIACFQPHRYSRTKILAEEFGKVFKDVDKVIVTDIYSAGEKSIPGVSSELIVKSIQDNGHDNVEYIHSHEEIVEYLLHNLRAHDLLVTLGAGDIWKVGEQFLEKWHS